MDIGNILVQSGAIDGIANQLGIPPAMARAGAGALLPAILGGFKGQAQQQSGGLGDLIGMIGGMGGAGMLEQVIAPNAANVGQGNDVLGQIFGSKDVSRTVAADASAKSGLDLETLKKMLPLLAMAVAGYMAYQGRQGRQGADGAAAPADGGGLGGILGSVLGGGGAQQGGGGLGGILGSILGGGGAATPQAAPAGGLGGLGSMLDLDGDGNPLDDIIGMAGRMTGR